MAPRKKKENETISMETEEKDSVKEVSLEDNFEVLDSIVEQLESGESTLEESFALYQKGMRILKQCSDSIDKVEKKLIVLEEEGI